MKIKVVLRLKISVAVGIIPSTRTQGTHSYNDALNFACKDKGRRTNRLYS